MTAQDETYQFFVQESLELLQTLESGLLNLRQNAHPKQFHPLMRAAHSLKGGAACVGLSEISELAHNLENVFSALMQRRPEVDVDLEELLLQAFDTLKSPLLHQIHGEPVEADSAIATLQPILSRLEHKLGCNLAQIEEDLELPGMEDEDDSGLPEADMTQMLLAEEIHQGIARWESLLRDPDSHAALGEDLISQAEVLATIGQLVNMSQVAAIAQTALQALQANPAQAKTIAHLALADFRLTQGSGAQNHPNFQPNPQLVRLTRPVADKAASQALSQAPNGKPPTRPPLNGNGGNGTGAVISRPASRPSVPPAQTPAVKPSPSPTATVAASAVKTPAVTPVAVATPPVQPAVQVPPKAIPTPTKTPPVVAVPTPSSVSVEPDGAEMAPAASTLGIRVDLERLELLNNLVGELVTQENTFLLQHQQHQEILDTVQQKLNRLQKLNRSLQFWSLKTAKPVFEVGETGEITSFYASSKILRSSAYARYGLRHAMPDGRLSPTRSEYSLHDLLQTVLEEMAQIEETLQDLVLTHSSVQPLLKKRQKSLKQVQTNLQQARMLPIGNLLHRFGRMIRDLSIKNNKPVELQLLGEKTLVDKVVLEKLYDPLVHLVRNAFDHGIEAANLRQAAGKPPTGNITIRAYHRGNSTYVEVMDDGAGIEHEKIRKTLVSRQLMTPQAADKLSPESLQQYLFAPGFSTASTVNELSGRGFGLELVQRAVETLKGSIQVRSRLGQGTTFRLRLPFSLTVERLLVFSVESHLFALPMTSLLGVSAVPENQIEQHQGQAVYQWRGYQIPVRSLFPLSHYRYPRISTEGKGLNNFDQVGNRPSLWQQSGKVNLLFISHSNDAQKGASVMAIPINQVLMEQDLVIKPFSTTLTAPPYFYGCTVLGDGRLVPVLDAAALISPQELVVSAALPASLIPPVAETLAAPATILVVDDSPTMRKTLSVTLSKDNYQVVQARHGLEALSQLQQNPAIAAIICDLEMPQMNGFEFLSRYAQDFAGQPRPILMLTSRSSEKYRQQAFKLGATGYLSKPYLDRELLQQVAEALRNK